MNVLVAQLGARRHYAVPQAFHKSGALYAFCTDIYLNAPISRRLLGWGGESFDWKPLSRLSGRSNDLLPPRCIRTFPGFGLVYKWRVGRARTLEDRAAAWIWGGRKFCKLAASEMGSECNMVYAFSSAALELFQHAGEKGRRKCLDNATAPLHVEIALNREEAERFGSWAVSVPEDVHIEDYRERQIRELNLADVVICASSFARRLVEEEGIPPDRIRTVPLAISTSPVPARKPRKSGDALRVLFVGGDGLRKGVGYLAQAVERLDSSWIDVKVAGDLRISATGLMQLRRSLALLGAVPRTEMAALYRWADVLVLPSVSDTFGMVILEAMAAGVPVITTPNTGGPDVIREGMDGFIVPVRDVDAIAEKLELFATDRTRIDFMSRNAVEQTREFSIERYNERLIAACTPVS